MPSKIGLFTFQIVGIPYILHFLLHVDVLPLSPQMYSIFGFILFASLLLIMVSSLIQKGGLGGIFWIFDITGLLGDVMSYCRLAGVGLATFYLASCFNMLADLVYGMASGIIPGLVGFVVGGIIAIVVLVFGHMLNLVLSGLTAFIHSLRLCFVEFLFKFYEGGGRQYSPFQLRTRALVTIRGRS